MRFAERSYSGKLFRPTPETHIEEDGSFGVIATPWGPRASAVKVIELLTDFVQSARQDLEATSPFQKMTSLSPIANSLRSGMMLANDTIYREDNKSEYTAGVEVIVFAHMHGEFSFAQVGHPHLLLARKGLPWIPISTQMDLAAELSQKDQLLPPMPQNVIGLHTSTNMNISSFKTQPGDRLVLLSHSLLGHPMREQSFEHTQLDAISHRLAQAHPELPFWLGVLEY